MLHSKIYNQGICRDDRDAFARRDADYFHSRIFNLAGELIATSSRDNIYVQLHIAVALLDSIQNGGETVSLMTDFINL